MPAKQLDWQMLKQWAQVGLIYLKYLDESGCCCESATEYAYSKQGQHKRIDQRKRRGCHISLLGLWQPQEQFDYALIVGTLKAPSFVRLMDWQATKAEQHFRATGQLTVMVLDNASVHRCQLAQEHYERWQQQGLLLFFLPLLSTDEPHRGAMVTSQTR